MLLWLLLWHRGCYCFVARLRGLFTSFYLCLTSPPFPGLSHLISWLSFSLLFWGLRLPAEEGERLHIFVGLTCRAGWQLRQNTPGRSSVVKWELVIVWVCELHVTLLACTTADSVFAGYFSWFALYMLSLPWGVGGGGGLTKW
jgi:hypothetical protein